MKANLVILTLLAALLLGANGLAAIHITEWMYGGENGEFVELTNRGTSPIDMTGWSYDDDSREPGLFDLSGFGIVLPGQSVILTEAAAEDFRLAWNLSASIVILGEYTNNLGRADEINIFDADDNLVDRLTYGDNAPAGGPRTNTISGNIPPEALGLNTAPSAVLSEVGDFYGSWASAGGDIGNPGVYAIPEPATMALIAGGLVALLRRRTR